MYAMLSSCPVVAVHETNLFQRVEVAGNLQMVPFVKKILWVRQSSTIAVLRHRGNDVRELFTLNDWYGFLTSLEKIARESSRHCDDLEIRIGDALTIDGDVVIEDVPVMEDLTKDGIEWNQSPGCFRKKYYGVDERWYTASNDGGSGLLEKKLVAESTGIYSTGLPCSDFTKWIEEQRREAQRKADQCQKQLKKQRGTTSGRR